MLKLESALLKFCIRLMNWWIRKQFKIDGDYVQAAEVPDELLIGVHVWVK
jgi:hypothetical protein